ncbi:hypothetical protein L2E82_48403 [Cichorium intybus]|uniref:Uncharacterized protein n=1 Tax=Cichorium intybus TaxID=13427 RepID=A0ACB8YYA8_CICIN|nr:hypothetical protein L2E82_48403 [Cichorium intybus]
MTGESQLPSSIIKIRIACSSLIEFPISLSMKPFYIHSTTKAGTPCESPSSTNPSRYNFLLLFSNAQPLCSMEPSVCVYTYTRHHLVCWRRNDAKEQNSLLCIWNSIFRRDFLNFSGVNHRSFDNYIVVCCVLKHYNNLRKSLAMGNYMELLIWLSLAHDFPFLLNVSKLRLNFCYLFSGYTKGYARARSRCGKKDKVGAQIYAVGFHCPTPIQEHSWYISLENRDIMAITKTCSGKTLGYLILTFMLPKRCHNNPYNGHRVVVLSHTSKRATQIHQIQDEAIQLG